MKQRRFGLDGPLVSVLGLGGNNFGMKLDAEQSAAVVQASLDVGVTHFDTAEMYGEGKSEEFLGLALQGRRDQVTIATKFLPRPDGDFHPGDLSARVIAGAEGSLTRLNTDYIDVFYQHYPDPQAPLDELLDAFEKLVAAGKVRHTALSNVDATQLETTSRAAADGRQSSLVGVQVEWNLLSRDAESNTVPAARAAGLGVIPYFPLASGLLTGKYAGGQFPEGSRFALMPYFAAGATPERLSAVDRLTALATAHGRTITELALGWLLAQQDVASVIAGASTPEQVRVNASSIGWQLTDAEVAEVDKALAG